MDTVINIVMHGWWTIKDLPWDAILVTLGGSSVVAVVTQFIKHRLNNKTRAKVLSIVGALAVIPDALNWLVANPAWAQYLPTNFAWVFTGAVALHAVLSTPPFHKLRILLMQYKQALEVVQEAGSVQSVNPPISNPNLSLNDTPAQALPQAQARPETPTLRID